MKVLTIVFFVLGAILNFFSKQISDIFIKDETKSCRYVLLLKLLGLLFVIIGFVIIVSCDI